ncbi:hypothetical protein FACS1894142_2560 [Spirochaetia bacterium]|nr:hypothetical protein FACS1894142_2560 [Spirochaetia bacterium]
MKKRFTMIGLAALTAAALLLSACNPAFEPSGDDFKGDWNSALSRSDYNGSNGLTVTSVSGDGGGGSYVGWGSKAQITINFGKIGGGGFSLDEDGIKAGVSIKEVTGIAPTDTTSAIDQPNPVGSALAYTVLSLRDDSVILQLDLTSVTHDGIRVDIDATKFYANNGLKLNGDGDNTTGEEEDSYYIALTVNKNSLLPTPLLTPTVYPVNLPAHTTNYSVSGNFVTDNSSSGTGLVNGLELNTSYDGNSSFQIANRAGIKSFLDANVIIEKYSDGSWTTITKGTFEYYDTGAYLFSPKWYASLSGIVEGTILRARVQNVKTFATTGTINGYPAKFTTKDNDSNERIFVDPIREPFGTPGGANPAETQWIAVGSVFNPPAVESDNGRNYRIVIPVQVSNIGYNGLASYDASHFVLVKFDNNYPVYVPVQSVTTRTTTRNASTPSNTLTTVVTHIVLDLGGFTTLNASGYDAAVAYEAKAFQAPGALSRGGSTFNATSSGNAYNVIDAVYSDVRSLGYGIDDAIADAIRAWINEDDNNVRNLPGAKSVATTAAQEIADAALAAKNAADAANGVTNDWKVLVNPAAKTAADTAANFGIEKKSRFIGNSGSVNRTNIFNEAPYYGWSVLGGDSTKDL